MRMPPIDEIHDALAFCTAGGAEFAELFFESTLLHAVVCEDGRVERVTSGLDEGFGFRATTGTRTAYGYSNRLDGGELMKIGRGVLAELGGSGGREAIRPGLPATAVAEAAVPAEGVPVEKKVEIVLAADRAARAAGSGIGQVQAACRDSLQRVSIFNSEGVAVSDERRQIVFTVRAIATDGHDLQTAYRSIGGRAGFEIFDDDEHEALAAEAGKSALTILGARRAPAGTMTVVLASCAGGTMTHEAIGHGLEGDAAEKGLSIYSGKVGERVASPLVTVIDDATLAGRRGSYGFDDEGAPARRTVSVERGVLRGYLLDRRTARKTGRESTGNGRRQNFRFRPIVRMSNTFIAPGEDDPAAIVAEVDRGLYVARMGGGQVDTSSGDFVFKVNEAFLIEKGRIGEPVRGATLIGNGPQVLREIDRVGDDLGFDIGTCGKDGQQVPVADAQPTLRIPSITVGGEA